MISSDPFILSQHAMFIMPKVDPELAKPLPFKEQQKFTRTVYTHKFIDRYILLNFNLHNIHHQYPNIAHYQLHKIPFEFQNNISLRQWIKSIKNISLIDVLWPKLDKEVKTHL